MNTTLRLITTEAHQLLSYIPLAAVLGGIAFLLMLMINRGRRIGRCFVRGIFVFYMTLLIERVWLSRIGRTFGTWDLIPLVSLSRPEKAAEFFLNTVMLIPFGFLVPIIIPKSKPVFVVLLGLVMSVVIELIQGMCRIGYVEIDDVISNTLGVLIGVMLYRLIRFLGSGRYGQNRV